jgi:hypothetical protein
VNGAPISGVSQWATSGSNISYIAGNIGIGTTTPSAKLSFSDASGSSVADGISWSNSLPLSYGIYKTAGSWTAPDYQQLKLSWNTGIVLDPGTAFGKSYVDVQGNGLRVTTGNVGIGTATPNAAYKLDVNGTAAFNSALIKATASNNYGELRMYNDINKFSQLFFTGSAWSTSNNRPNAAGIYSGGSGGLVFLADDAAAPITFATSNIYRMIIDPVGNVGIGTSTPNAAYL